MAPAHGAIDVRFVGHATTLLELEGIRVLTDPFLRTRLGPLERHGAVPDPSDLTADVVLISHGHPDHLDTRSLAALPGDPLVIAPRGLAVRCSRARPGARVIELDAGEAVDVEGLAVRAVPARHWISPGAPRARPIGFVLDAGPRIYFAGDTGRYDEMPDVAGGVDLALLPIWTWGPHLGPGHLGPRSAARVVSELSPAAVVPIHWGTLYPRHLHRVWQRPLRQPGERFAAFSKAFAPGVDVFVLAPGESTTIEAHAREA